MNLPHRDIELGIIGSAERADHQTLHTTPSHRTTWPKSLILERVQTGLTTGAASIRSHWSVQWVARWTPRRPPKTASSISDGETITSTARDEYIAAVMGDGSRSELVEAACQWHLQYLECQIRAGWIPLFRRVLRGVDTAGLKPNAEELSITFRVLTAMVEQFTLPDRAPVQIVDELYNDKLLIETPHPEDSDYERSPANQMVFASLGLTSMLFTPELNPDENKFQISDIQARISTLGGTIKRRRLVPKSKTFDKYKETLDRRDNNVAVLLRCFGTIIPRCQRPILGGLYSPRPGSAPLAPDTKIESSFLNFRNMYKVVGINIEWVDCLSLHLEFDRSGKVLKLFRFPSICLMMCCGKEKSTFAEIFLESINHTNPTVCNLDKDEAREYYKEVLLSYRLIFGEVQGAAEDFTRHAQEWAPALGEQSDPLLAIICGQHWESEEAWSMYQEIGAEEPADHYVPAEDFPYLGSRLLKVQEYLKDHRPNTIMQMWHDSVNKWNWWMLFAFIILGCLALLFAIIQTLLQAVQVYYTLWPPH